MALSETIRGSGNNTTSATSVQILPASVFAAGSTAILVLGYDNSGSGGIDPFASITDAHGNPWESVVNALYDPGAASAGVTLRIFLGRITTSLGIADAITVNFSTATVAKAWVLREVITNTANATIGVVSNGVSTGAATATPSVTTGPIATVGDMVIGAGASESASTWVGDADTTGGSWTAQTTAAAGTGTSGIAVTTQSKVVNAVGSQTYNPTLTAADRILAWVQLTEVVGGSYDPFGRFGFFGM